MARLTLMFVFVPSLCGAHGISRCDDDSNQPTFAEFIDIHARTYEKGTDEYEMRKDLFDQRVQEVREQNCREGSLWWADINRLSDWTEEELAKIRGYKGHRRSSGPTTRGQGPLPTELMMSSAKPLPKEMDWNHLTAMIEVQDQGGCGSCWAFAASTVLRAHSEIYQQLRRFSVQQIVSCTPNIKTCGGTGGCNGATAELAMDYVMSNGCVTEDELPYNEIAECPESMQPRAVSLGGPSFMEAAKKQHSPATSFGMTGWTQLPANEMEPLKRALVEQGPVAVTIASSYSWNQYAGGIMDNCPRDADVDHAVALIGYGADAARKHTKYWMLQNSWGTSWGEAGFIRMLRRDDDETEQCGWDHQPRIGSGCDGGPSRVWVCGMCGILYDTVVPHFQGDGKRAKRMASRRQEVVLLKRKSGPLRQEPGKSSVAA